MENRQVVLQNTPNSLILNTGIPMYDDVAKINDLPKTINLFGKSRVYFRCLIQSFADNFRAVAPRRTSARDRPGNYPTTFRVQILSALRRLTEYHKEICVYQAAYISFRF